MLSVFKVNKDSVTTPFILFFLSYTANIEQIKCIYGVFIVNC